MNGNLSDGSRRATDRDPLPLGHAIRDYLDLHELAPAGVLSSVLAVWDETVGTEIASHARPLGLHDDELVVAVDHAAWGPELAFLQEPHQCPHPALSGPKLQARPVGTTASEEGIRPVDPLPSGRNAPPVPSTNVLSLDDGTGSYEAGDITLLEGLEPVRKRPGMFIGSTANHYGLTVNDQVDERMDISLETDAAMRLLTGDYLRFKKNWELSVLAYNVGEEKIQRAIASTGSRDAWTLIRAGLSTDKDYYPRLMAAILIMRNPRTLE